MATLTFSRVLATFIIAITFIICAHSIVLFVIVLLCFLAPVKQIACFAVDIDESIGKKDSDAAKYAFLHEERTSGIRTSFEDTRFIVSELHPLEGGILAHSRHMLHWHKYNKFCPNCGSRTKSMEGGYMRKCIGRSDNDEEQGNQPSHCSKEHYPRTDPCIITLIGSSSGDKCLLARRINAPTGRYGLLAGFIEPGETIESGK